MTDTALIAHVVTLCGLALPVALAVVECKRAIVRKWRGWLVQLEQERCDLAHAPIYCGRVRE